MSELQGKAALVTGGGRGIGAAIARRLAADGAAAAVTYGQSEDAARALVEEIKAGGGAALAIRADNRDAAAVEAAVDAAADAFGGLDILVNNAGVIQAGPLAELDMEAFDRTMDINVRGAFAAARAADRRINNDGRIVFIGSNLAAHAPAPGLGLYASSKAALAGLSRGLARDFGPRGVTVNVVHPGSTDTEMNPADGPSADMLRGMMAIPRFNTPEDVAAMVAWLAGPQARAVTGAEMTVDGGTNA